MTSALFLADLLESPVFQLERLRRRTREEVEAALAKRGLNVREYWVLTCLSSAQASSQSALCDMLSIDASDMVRLIDALENRQWAKRERDPQDRRRQIVSSTKKGRANQKSLRAIVAEAEARALTDSSAKQLKHLRKLTEQMLGVNQPLNQFSEAQADQAPA